MRIKTMDGHAVKTDRKPSGARERLRRVALEVAGIAVVLLLATSARSTLADHYHVPTGSMLPTVQLKDRILVNKLAYGLRVPLTTITLAELDEPSPGDVVVLESPTDGTILLKRVIAVPGDQVAVTRGRVIRNGRLAPVHRTKDGLSERLGTQDHALRLTYGGGPDLPLTVVPPERFLVMGDNRGDSLDGRSFGLVERKAILGRTVGVFFSEGRAVWREL